MRKHQVSQVGEASIAHPETEIPTSCFVELQGNGAAIHFPAQGKFLLFTLFLFFSGFTEAGFILWFAPVPLLVPGEMKPNTLGRNRGTVMLPEAPERPLEQNLLGGQSLEAQGHIRSGPQMERDCLDTAQPATHLEVKG